MQAITAVVHAIEITPAWIMAHPETVAGIAIIVFAAAASAVIHVRSWRKGA
jgi:hypothetical protein